MDYDLQTAPAIITNETTTFNPINRHFEWLFFFFSFHPNNGDIVFYYWRVFCHTYCSKEADASKITHHYTYLKEESPLLADMGKEHHDGLIARFLPRLAREANERGVVCGKISHKQWISKGVAKGIEMSYVFPKTKPSRIEMRIYHGKEDEDVDSAHEVFKHFLSRKSEIELYYGGSLNWNYEGRRTAFSIQQDYHDFRLSDDSKWDHWVDRIVTDMKKLDDALLPHYINSRI